MIVGWEESGLQRPGSFESIPYEDVYSTIKLAVGSARLLVQCEFVGDWNPDSSLITVIFEDKVGI
jgi:hypothetical protein